MDVGKASSEEAGLVLSDVEEDDDDIDRRCFSQEEFEALSQLSHGTHEEAAVKGGSSPVAGRPGHAEDGKQEGDQSHLFVFANAKAGEYIAFVLSFNPEEHRQGPLFPPHARHAGL
jgi:hypothetical protein